MDAQLAEMNIPRKAWPLLRKPDKVDRYSIDLTYYILIR